MIHFSKILLFFFFADIATNSFSQDINYTFRNYTLKDGLAGNNVYCATQDKEGFIWFGTETGLSRFDGSHFKNYTVADGLPDNEILNIFTDSKGRIWLMPFKKSISYIYKNKIFNSSNDNILRNLKMLGNCYDITEDNAHNIIIHDTKAIHIVNSRGDIKNIFAESLGENIQFVNVYKTVSGSIYVLTKRDVFKIDRNKLIKVFTLPEENIYPFQTTGQVITDSSVLLHNMILKKENYTSQITEHFFYKKEMKFYQSPIISGMFGTIGNKLYTTSIVGADLIDINNNQHDSIIINKPVNRLFMDRECSIYLLTRNAGINVKSNAEIKHKSFSSSSNKYLGVDCINGSKTSLFIGATNNNPIVMDKINLSNTTYLSEIKHEGYSNFGRGLSPICYLAETNSNYLLLANADGMFRLKKNEWGKGIDKISIKHVQEVGDRYLLGTVDKLITVNKTDFKIIDTLWNERTTAASFINNNYYIGTINGLYRLNLNKLSTYLGDSFPVFQRRISAIKKAADGTIWVGTYDAGVAAYKNGKVVQIFNDSNGLTSNICRNLFVNGNYLWVGTDKGLNKIDISKPPYKIVINYTTTDGLASNMINAVYADSNMVYVGTPEGLTFFDETKIVNDSKCDMRILSITISSKEQQWDSSKIILAHNDNNIRFDFVALSFKSAGDISYTYRLVGLDDEWKTTRENYLSYPSLPSGNYTLEIQATNKFGVQSSIVKIDVEIKKLLIEKNWFRLLLLLTVIGLMYAYFTRRIKKINQKATEQAALTEKVNEMEQMALKAQMNPHFIFNCLNSIQEYVINTDVKGANKFITDFSKLIRSTLDNSSKKAISIQDEINYLTTYLTLEKGRFENKFNFNIYASPDININDTYIPPMLLQPYIENAIRHGINNKKEGEGLIQINILKVSDSFICEIIDNGIGRAAAQKLKGNTAIEYQSKGMELTAKRIQLLNKNVAQNIVVQIEDLYIPNTGTKVTITIPINEA